MEGSKDFTWKQSTASWTSNQDIDINDDTKGYKIAGTTILSKTALASSVTSAPGLTSFGTLAELTVDNVKIDGQTISRVGGAGLIIDANGDTSLANNKITNLATPTGSADAATKNYVDVQLNAQSLLVPLDVTGLTDPDDILTNDGPYTSIRNILELLRAASSTESGTVAKVLATSYSNSTVSGIGVTISTSPDSSGVLQKAVVSVRDAADTGSESVIQDIAASNTASGSVSLTATRYIYEYTNVAGTWTYTLGTRTQVTVT